MSPHTITLYSLRIVYAMAQLLEAKYASHGCAGTNRSEPYYFGGFASAIFEGEREELPGMICPASNGKKKMKNAKEGKYSIFPSLFYLLNITINTPLLFLIKGERVSLVFLTMNK